MRLTNLRESLSELKKTKFRYFKRVCSSFNFILVVILIALIRLEHLGFFAKSESRSYKTQNLIKNHSFEQGLENWQIDHEKDPTLLVLGAKVINFRLKPEFVDKTMRLEYMPNSTYQSVHPVYLQFKLNRKDNKGLISITYTLTQSGPSSTPRHTLGGDEKVGFVIAYNLSPEIIQKKWNPFELNLISDSNRLLKDKGLAPIESSLIGEVNGLIASAEIFNPNNIKLRGWYKYFDLEKDPYDEVGDIREFDPSTNKPIGSYINSFFSLPSHGRKHLNLNGRYSYVYQKVSDLDPKKTYILIADAKAEENPVYPPKVSISDSRHKVIVSRKFTEQMAQLGWVRVAIIFKPRTKDIYVKLGNGKRDGYYPFTLNQYDNIILHEVSYSNEFASFIDSQYDVKLSFRYPRGAIVKPGEFPLDYKEIMPAKFAEKLEKEYQSLDMPIYDIYVDESEMWHYKNSEYTMWGGDEIVKDEEEHYYSYRFGKGYRNMVPAKLKLGETISDVRIKTRGLGPSHHINKNKSLKISFSKSEFFYLLQRPFLVESFGYYIARQLGIIALNNKLVYLRINDKLAGISWELQYDEGALTDNKRADGYVYKDEFRGWRNIIERQPQYWTLQVKSSNEDYAKKYPPRGLIDYFLQLLRENKIAIATNFVKLDKLLAWEALSSLTGSSHQDSRHNLSLYWDTSQGLFEPIPYDLRSIGGNVFQIHFSSFSDSFLYIFENFNKRNKILWDFVMSENNLQKFISYSQEFFLKNVEAFQRLGREEKFRLSYQDYIEKYRNRYRSLKEKLSENGRFKIEIQKSSETLDINNPSHSVLVIKVIPEKNSQVSATYIRKIVLEDYQSEGRLLLPSLSEIEATRTGDNTEWLINRPIPSNFFFENKIKHLWKNQYDFIVKKLTPHLEDKYFFKEAYSALKGPGSDREYAFILKHSLDDEEKINRLFSVLKKAGYIKHNDSLTFYLSYPRDEDINVRNLKFDLENAVTGEKMVSGIQILEIASSININNEMESSGASGSDPITSTSSVKPPFGFAEYKYLSPQSFIKKYPFFKIGNSQPDTIFLKKGSYKIKQDIIIPSNINLIIESGVEMKLARGVSLLSYGNITAIGTEEEPIVFTSLKRNKGWGVIAIAHKTGAGKFEHCLFERGNEAYINGIYFSGMLSAHYGNVSVDNCEFQYASERGGDDALNFKNSHSTVRNSVFFKNKFDAIDFDFMDGEISHNKFIDNGNDSIDTSYSSILITDNYIEKSGDKGISIGEKSAAKIVNNVMYNCKIGIEVKDLSAPIVVNNVIAGNDIGINSYQKKRYFGGGHGKFYNILLLENKREITFENTLGRKKLPTDNSDIVIEYSNISERKAGLGNVKIDLDLSTLKSDNWLSFDQKLVSGGNLEELRMLLPDYNKAFAPIGLMHPL